MSDFEGMTVAQLKSYATENGVDLGDAKTKTKILAVLLDTDSNISAAEEASPEQKIIGSDKIVTGKRTPVSATRPNEDGVMTTSTADTFKNKKFEETKKINDSKIAIFSEKNLHWNGVGGIKRGYNIVTKEASEKWLTRKGIREATPEEIATHYGL